MDRIKERICAEFEDGELSYIDAIDELMKLCGHSPLDAELTISDLDGPVTP